MRLEPWEAAGDDLKRRWRAGRKNAKHVKLELPEFNKAILSYLQGDQAKLSQYLCAHPISRAEQEEIAWALNERAKVRKGRPKSLRQMNIEGRAQLASLFFRAWRDMNKSMGINDWGNRGEMKRQACEFAVELLGGSEADAEAVRLLLDRPISRRK